MVLGFPTFSILLPQGRALAKKPATVTGPTIVDHFEPK
jgi:hypothetical protein